MKIVLGTRASRLALTQSGLIAAALRGLGHQVEMRTIRTSGDVITGSLARQGGTGVFAAALREALLAGEVDLAVHSFKDLPTAPVPGLVVAAVPAREDPRDVLCSRDGLSLMDLPPWARVGTGSPRRAAQLKALRPDLALVEIRGNVPTRLARALGEAADLDAVVLAAAGLVRLGLAEAITEPLAGLLPAPAQGALALECRADDTELRTVLAGLDDAEAHFAAVAERTVLAELGAGCAAPIGASCVRDDQGYRLRAGVRSPDGSKSISIEQYDSADGDAVSLGRRVATALLASGAAEITPLGDTRDSRLAEFHDDRSLWAPGTTTELVGRHLLLPRADGALAAALRMAGAEVDCVPLTETVTLPVASIPSGDWTVLTSPTAVRIWLSLGGPAALGGARVAAVGPGTRAALETAGVEVALTPSGTATAQALAEAFPAGDGRIVIPGSALSGPELASGLAAKGWQVQPVATYTTRTRPEAPAALRQSWARGDFDAVVLTAGSVARAARELLGTPPGRTRVVAFGRPSASAATELGFTVAAVAASQDGPGLLHALVTALTGTRAEESS